MKDSAQVINKDISIIIIGVLIGLYILRSSLAIEPKAQHIFDGMNYINALYITSNK
jgi:hypothetical protein